VISHVPSCKAYIDPDLSGAYADDQEAVREAVADAWDRHTAVLQGEVGVLRAEVTTVLAPFRAQLRLLQDAIVQALRPFQTRVETVQEAVEAAQRTFAPDRPDAPVPHADPGDETAWLFDSARDYDAQLGYDKARKGHSPPSRGAWSAPYWGIRFRRDTLCPQSLTARA
jgi:hypothetical protein